METHANIPASAFFPNPTSSKNNHQISETTENLPAFSWEGWEAASKEKHHCIASFYLEYFRLSFFMQWFISSTFVSTG